MFCACPEDLDDAPGKFWPCGLEDLRSNNHLIKRNPDLDSSSRRNRVSGGPTVVYRLLKRSRERERVVPLLFLQSRP